MRRPQSIRLTLLPLLASASLAAAQEVSYEGSYADDPPPYGLDTGDPIVAMSLEALDAWDPEEDDEQRERPDALLVVPNISIDRGGFGAYVFSVRS